VWWIERWGSKRGGEGNGVKEFVVRFQGVGRRRCGERQGGEGKKLLSEISKKEYEIR